MDPVSIAIVCVAVFGAVTALAAFIRQLLLSRDKRLNDAAHRRALAQQATQMEELRTQMVSIKRFDSHYQVLGSNEGAIRYLDKKIEDLIQKKSDVIQRYSQTVFKESSAIISGQQSPQRKAQRDGLKAEVCKELLAYDNELENLQKRRKNLWESHAKLEDSLLYQETLRNEHLDKIYQEHSSMLEKLFARHNEDSDSIAKLSLEAGKSAFQLSVNAPAELLRGTFKPSDALSSVAALQELSHRREVLAAERDINTDAVADEHRTPAQQPQRELNVLN